VVPHSGRIIVAKIVGVIQKKGGAGKTTLSVHLATQLKEHYPELRIVVADADTGQNSATKWLNRSAGSTGVEVFTVADDGVGKNLKQELEKLDADLIVLDLPPFLDSVSLRAALYSKLILVPVGPTPLDIEAAEGAISVCKEAIDLDGNKSFLIVPNRVQQSTSSGRELRSVLEEWGPVSKATLGHRVAYSDSATVGVGINKYAPGSIAHQEIEQLAREVAEIIGL
jgi:chromosome partitioning protein